MASCATYRTWLASAETALNALLTGAKVEVLRHGEKSLTYSRAAVPELRAYIATLQSRVDACDGLTTNRRRILRVLPIG